MLIHTITRRLGGVSNREIVSFRFPIPQHLLDYLPRTHEATVHNLRHSACFFCLDCLDPLLETMAPRVIIACVIFAACVSFGAWLLAEYHAKLPDIWTGDCEVLNITYSGRTCKIKNGKKRYCTRKCSTDVNPVSPFLMAWKYRFISPLFFNLCPLFVPPCCFMDFVLFCFPFYVFWTFAVSKKA